MAEEQQTVECGGVGNKFLESVRSNEERPPSFDNLSHSKEESPRDPQDVPQTEGAAVRLDSSKALITLMSKYLLYFSLKLLCVLSNIN